MEPTVIKATRDVYRRLCSIHDAATRGGGRAHRKTREVNTTSTADRETAMDLKKSHPPTLGVSYVLS